MSNTFTYCSLEFSKVAVDGADFIDSALDRVQSIQRPS